MQPNAILVLHFGYAQFYKNKKKNMINCTFVTKRTKINIMLQKGRQLDLNINLRILAVFQNTGMK